MEFVIRKGTIEECIHIEKQLEEFDGFHSKQAYLKRFRGKYSSIFVAEVEGKVAACKAGYLGEGYFYSWIGGVLPAYRRHGIAKALAVAQEEDCRRKGIAKIRFKTYSKFDKMLKFALQNGFVILSKEKKTGKILLEKKL